MKSEAPPSARCPTFTLDDAPAGEDEFGSHEPIADAIHELIMGEHGGRTIGLRGHWGSGKSTVVRLLGERMRGADAHIVVFDAWAHEGDPLRRSFLETLIGSLCGTGWVDGEAWRARREALARRHRVERTRSEPLVEPRGIVAGAVAVLLALLVPLGAALLSAGLTSRLLPAWLLGAVLYAIPLVLVLAALAWLGWLTVRGRSGAAVPGLLSLFAVQSVTESDRETVETPDPTSLEFERLFRQLMSEALDGHPRRRLLLVVDNLDRVAPEDARSVWATLQTFLHHTQEPRAPWVRSLWVVLPYDPGGIERLWEFPTARPEQGDPQPATLTRSFLEKSIQVHFEVPLPLLTDWRGYLSSLLRSALPCHDDDHYAIYRLYQYRPAARARAPSPRELTLYVNRIGALHRRWQHELPLASLAYYASLDRPASDVASGLASDPGAFGHLPSPDVKPLLDGRVEAHLAAIAFNAAPERALQLLYGPRIDSALMREEAEGLVELASRPGFWEALAGSGFVRVPSSAPPTLLLAASRLAEIPEELRPDDVWGEVTTMLARAGREADTWAPLTPTLASRLADLLALVGPPHAAEIAATATAAAIAPGGGADWAQGAHALLSRVEWLTVQVSGDAEAVLDALVALARIAGWGEVVGRLAFDPDDRPAFDAALAQRVAAVPGEALPALEVLRGVDPGLDWEPLVSAAAGRLGDAAPSRESPPQVRAGAARSLLGILRAAPDGSRRERAALVRAGLALAYLGMAAVQDDDAALGDWLHEVLEWSTPEQRSARSYGGDAEHGKDLVDHLFAFPTLERVGPLARAMARRPGSDLIARIRRQAGGNELAAALAESLEPS